MKTPMQEHIEWLKEERGLYGYEKQAYFETAIEHAESMLEKEEDVKREQLIALIKYYENKPLTIGLEEPELLVDEFLAINCG